MEFAKSVEISNATLAKMGKDEAVSLTTIDKICNVYDCDIENIVKHLSTIKVDDKFSPELNIGTIISTQYLLSRVLIHSSVGGKFYYVITEKERDEQLFLFEDIKQYTYKIALLTSKPSNNDLYIPIPHLKLSFCSLSFFPSKNVVISIFLLRIRCIPFTRIFFLPIN